MNQNDYNQVFLRILEIVNYQGDKDKFITDFIDVSNTYALMSLVESLSEDEKSQIKTNVQSSENKEEAMSKIVKEKFTTEEITEAMKKAHQDNLEQYIKTILPTLTEGQKTELEKFLSSNAQ